MVSGLSVVGFHGRLGENQTPARRAPVLADAKGRLATIIEASPDDGARGFRLTVEVAPRKIDAGIWSSTGTRIDPPWPTRLGNIVVIVGGREMQRARELAEIGEGVPTDEPERVAAFARWLCTDTRRSDDLCCMRVDDLLAWYCTRDEARALWRRIAIVAKRDVIDAAMRNPSMLERTSLWLSRAAVDDADMFLAVAGVRRAGYRHWQALLDAGVRSGSQASRMAAVDEAELRLPPTRSPSTNLPASPMSAFRRQAVQDSMVDLRAASQRARIAA
jgi:hypothetical protein